MQRDYWYTLRARPGPPGGGRGRGTAGRRARRAPAGGAPRGHGRGARALRGQRRRLAHRPFRVRGQRLEPLPPLLVPARRRGQARLLAPREPRRGAAPAGRHGAAAGSTARAWPRARAAWSTRASSPAISCRPTRRASSGSRRRATPAAATTSSSRRARRISTGLVRAMGRGLVVTELMGQGVNPVTGDYSRGAVGFWVEGGRDPLPGRGGDDRRATCATMYRGIVRRSAATCWCAARARRAPSSSIA